MVVFMAQESDPPPRAAEGGLEEERALLQRHLQGDRGAFPELIRRYGTPVYGYLSRCGVDAPSRDDLFQDIFIRIHNAADRYDPSRPLRPWIFTVVANVTRTWFRRQRVQSLVFPEDPPDPPDGAPDALAEVLFNETTRWLETAVAQLPLAQREVVILSCIERLSMAEVAAALDQPVGTVKTHLHRARLTLAQGWARRSTRGRPLAGEEP